MIYINELYHHGIKGQQWGVRRGPPYPIEDRVLAKGTKLNTVSPYWNGFYVKGRGAPVYTYRKDEEWDNKVYKGPFSKYLAVYRGVHYIYEHEYETVNDLKMPTKKQRVDEFLNLYKNDKATVVPDLVKVQELMKKYNIGEPEVRDIDVESVQTKEDYEKAYEIFNHAMEHYRMFASTKKYVEIMSTKYDAMVDDNNQGKYNDTHDPIIVFNAAKNLELVSTRGLTCQEVLDNYNHVKSELAKKGVAVKL